MLIYDWLKKESEDNACEPLINLNQGLRFNQRSTNNSKW